MFVGRAQNTVFRLVVLLLLLGSPSADARDNPLPTLQLELEMEQQLLDAALNRHDVLRNRQLQAEDRVGQFLARLDDLMSRESLPIDQIEDLEANLAVAQASVHAFETQGREARQQILSHQRRVNQLTEAIARPSPDRYPDDPISGRWEVHILPSGQEGFFELELNGAVVTGEYALDGEFKGSLRGTYVGGLLKLDRIDTRRGFDVVFQGRLGSDSDRIDGDWRSTLLNAPGAAGGRWRALRSAAP
ncbi:MAG: hypothetical protein K8J08_21005 [Thermoanaerobaculia bacterium]|nr:hypothetical protein [Thermoanaerobaculia bacterium]